MRQPNQQSGPIHPSIALAGNPNAGKTTLFNALTGLRAKTANFPGTTIEHRVGTFRLADKSVDLIDLPGLYSIAAATSEERVARDALLGQIPGVNKPACILLLLDSTNLERNLYLASQVLELKIPTIVALNMIDLAKADGIQIDAAKLSADLGCPVVPISAREETGLEDLRRQLEVVLANPASAAPKETPACDACGGCPFQARYDWAEGVGARCTTTSTHTRGAQTEKLDAILTHPVVGVVAFLGVMFGVFATIFWLARYPMDTIEWIFNALGGFVGDHISEGEVLGFLDLRSLLVEGVIAGVGGTVVFLPQIVILFFFLSLLEDTGYLARAAFVMDRLMRFAGLPGKAFVPLLSAHACAIPAIMATRSIDDSRDRLVTILVTPFMSCSARIPVYAMLATGLLYPHDPLKASALFTGAYILGIIAALATAWIFKLTFLKGETRPLVIELPSYKRPGIKNAMLFSADRAAVFMKKAGTVILLVSIILWAMATYPKSDEPAEAIVLHQKATEIAKENEPKIESLKSTADAARAAAEKLDAAAAKSLTQLLAEADKADADAGELKDGDAKPGDELRTKAKAQNTPVFEQLAAARDADKQIEELNAAVTEVKDKADRIAEQSKLANSAAGRIGHLMEPAIEPLGFNWQIGVGIFSSFAAREVIVATLAVVYGVGADAADEKPDSLYDSMRDATRTDGSKLFTPATCVSLLVFYVLAMQCFSTSAVVRRETGGWKWPIIQFGYMSALAYIASLITYQSLLALGIN